MKRDRYFVASIVSRCVRLRCPACGQSSIVKTPFNIKHHCPVCRALFKREDGFFVGALSVNVVTTELVILAIYILCLPIVGEHFRMVTTLLLMMALLFPVAFYHHSWSVWLSLDHFVETLPTFVGSQHQNGGNDGA